MNAIERFRKYREGGIVKFQQPWSPLDFRRSSQTYRNNLNNSYENVYASELNDSIQSNTSNYLANLSKYKTAVKKSNGNYLSLDEKGVFNYGGNTKNSAPYYKGFDADMARQIRILGKRKGLTDNQIATLIESGWRETNLKPDTHRKNKDGTTIAYGMWQFDGPAGTYKDYLKYLKGKPSTLETQMNYLIDRYMPTRGNFKSKYWDNPNTSLEDLATQFLVQVEAPKKRNDPKLQSRTRRAVKTIYGRK